MNLSYTQFQSLSACEAIAIEKTFAKALKEVFQAGIRTAYLMQTTSPHPKEWPGNARYYLEQVGIEVDDEIALEMIVLALASAVRREEYLAIKTD